ncbi:MAG: DUF2461 domain-containing protein [bacterium]
MITTVLPFLDDLVKNNNREWFQKNKPRYEQAKKDFESFLGLVIPAVAKLDPSVKFIEPKDCLFRIYRDVRFSKDKSPYKTNFGAFIAKGGHKSHGPGYYIHLQPGGGSFLAGGIYMPEPDMMKKIRQEIYYNVDELKSILKAKAFKKYFDGIDDWDKQKLPPREFPKDFPDIDLLKNRSFTVSSPMTDKMIMSAKLFDNVLSAFKAIQQYNSFLKRAVEG